MFKAAHLSRRGVVYGALASAVTILTASSEDDLAMPEDNEVVGCNDLARHTKRSLPGPSRRGVFITLGQSNIANSIFGLAGATNSNGYNFNPYDGHCYTPNSWTLGCSYNPQLLQGSLNQLISDAVLNAGLYSTFVFAPIGVHGADVTQFATGGSLNKRIVVVLRRLAIAGLPVDGILWQKGDGSGHSGDNYALALASVIKTFRANGCNAPFFAAQCTYLNGATNAGVRAAQAAVVDHAAGVWAGPDTDVIGLSGRDFTRVHFNVAGATIAAGLWKDKIAAYLNS
jgi:hypothetical protein